ncbi:MAG: tetratricopeptide repeat protein [Candidatus Omnitrophica bacterium]|nr:tetratricopeptide repeat protein [Candidatus Omnitrophota bacterium]
MIRKLILLGLFIPCLVMGCRSNHGWAKIFLQKGHQMVAKGDYDAAIAEFNKARLMDKENDQVYIAMAEVYWKKGDYDIVREYLGKAMRLNSQPAKYYAMLGDCLVKDGQDMSAVTDGYDRAILRDPSVKEYHQKRDGALQRWGASEKDYQMIVEKMRKIFGDKY